jgi:beta,beta-carotene 9',10'-dioxygenase
MDESTANRVQLASIGASTPAYMHSFGLTQHYIILPEYPYQVSPLDLLLQNNSFIETFKWKPKAGTKFIVVNRQTGKTVGTFKTDAFFALHQANAFELDDKTIVMDLVAYPDAAILTALKLDNLFDGEHNFPQGKLTRFTIDMNKKTVDKKELSSETIEMPRINYRAVSQKPYEFVYGAGSDNPHEMANRLLKINVTTGKALVWQSDQCYPAEPVFVASPDCKAEDDGVILAIVLDGKQQKSFVLILDAKDFKEIGRTYVPHHIPFTVHGNFFEKK